MYKGFISPPKMIRLFIEADGEAAYDLVQYDMFLLLLLLTLCLFVGKAICLRKIDLSNN